MRCRSPSRFLTITVLAFGAVGAASAQVAPPDSVRRLVDAGLAQEAYSYAQALAATAPDDPDVLAALAMGAMAVEDFDAALEAADALVAEGPENSRRRLILGQAYLSHARVNLGIGSIGKVKKGRAAVERAIELDPDNVEARHTLMQFLLQAPGIAGGNREGARRQAEEILRRDRRKGLLAMVEVAAAGDADELPAVLARSTPLLGTPADSGARLLGALLAAAGGLDEEDERERLTQRIYGAHPEHPVAQYHRARLWVLENERPADAERLLLRYLGRPEWRAGLASRAGAHWRLAQLYERQDREEQAKEHYRLAASLDSRLRRDRRTSERLEREL